VAANDSILPTAHYTVEPGGNSVKNTGGKGRDRAPTAQNTHNGRLKRSTSPHRRITARFN
jgi:hypothetical protein